MGVRFINPGTEWEQFFERWQRALNAPKSPKGR
jgi:hypothetical protein